MNCPVSGVGRPGDGLLPVPLTRCIQMHTPMWWGVPPKLHRCLDVGVRSTAGAGVGRAARGASSPREQREGLSRSRRPTYYVPRGGHTASGVHPRNPKLVPRPTPPAACPMKSFARGVCVWGGGGGGGTRGCTRARSTAATHKAMPQSLTPIHSRNTVVSVTKGGGGQAEGCRRWRPAGTPPLHVSTRAHADPLALKEWVCAEGPKGSTAVAAQRARAAPLAHAQSGRSEQRSACLSAGLRRRGTGNSKCVTGRGFVAVSVDPLDTGSSLHCSGTTPSHNPLRHLPRHWTLRSAGPLADAESVRIAAPQGCHRSQLSTVASSVLEHWTFSYSSTRLRKARQPLQPSQ